MLSYLKDLHIVVLWRQVQILILGMLGKHEEMQFVVVTMLVFLCDCSQCVKPHKISHLWSYISIWYQMIWHSCMIIFIYLLQWFIHCEGNIVVQLAALLSWDTYISQVLHPASTWYVRISPYSCTLSLLHYNDVCQLEKHFLFYVFTQQWSSIFYQVVIWMISTIHM